MNSPDNPSAMETSEPKIKNKKQNSESVRESKDSMAESVMKCPKCQVNFASSVEFRKQTNDQCELNIGLHQDSGDNSTAFFTDKLTFTKQPAITNAHGQCPNCKHSFLYKSVARWTNRMSGLNIELSINISKGKLEETSALMDNLGASGTQTQNRNYDEGMEQDDMEDSCSEKSTGCKSDGSSKWSGLNAASSRSTANWWPFPSIFKPPPSVVKVHYTPTSDTFGADAAIMKQLQNNLKSSMQLVETTKNCSIIIVFCPVNRSFESEIRSAMEKEAVSSCGKPFILVLMHHTRDPDHSTARCDCLEMLKNVFYVHVFYHETEKGLLRCNQNDMAIKAIERNLQTYKQ